MSHFLAVAGNKETFQHLYTSRESFGSEGMVFGSTETEIFRLFVRLWADNEAREKVIITREKLSATLPDKPVPTKKSTAW